MSLARRALRSSGAPCCLRCAWRPVVVAAVVAPGSTSTTTTNSGSTTSTQRWFAVSARRPSEEPSTLSAADQAMRDAIAGHAPPPPPQARPAAREHNISEHDDLDPDNNDDTPRWARTPPRMKAPFSLQQPKDPRRSVWTVNEDPARLDRMYEKLIGRDLTRTLPDELKWLAVTHKSFDNGRRGFNTRLAFYGRMIVALETTRSIMGSDDVHPPAADPYGRSPFAHPALAHVDKLHARQPHQVASPARLAQLGRDVGLLPVVRWKPRLPENLPGSGVDVVLTSTLFAIVGAVSLHHGAAEAARVVTERILRRLS